MNLKRGKTQDRNIDDEFMTRAEIIKTITFPESDRTKTIVKPNHEGIGFKFNCYSELIKPYVDKQRFDATVNGAHKICVEVWKIKKQEEHRVYNQVLKYLLYVVFLVMIAAFILSLIAIYGSPSVSMYYPILILFAISGGTSIFILVKVIIEKPTFVDLQSTTMDRLQRFLEKENDTFYRQKGLEWSSHKRYFWLECAVISEMNRN